MCSDFCEAADLLIEALHELTTVGGQYGLTWVGKNLSDTVYSAHECEHNRGTIQLRPEHEVIFVPVVVLALTSALSRTRRLAMEAFEDCLVISESSRRQWCITRKAQRIQGVFLN